MKPIVAAPIAMWGALTFLTAAAYGALPDAHPGPTVNDYTAAQSRRAKALAGSAGFDKLEIVMVQDGNFFLNGERQIQTCSLTVTRDGKVYSPALAPDAKK